jgi:alpha-glucosidase
VYADTQALAYLRQATGDKAFLIVLNLSHRPCYITLKHVVIDGTIIFSTSPALRGLTVNERIHLSGDEGIIAELNKEPYK